MSLPVASYRFERFNGLPVAVIEFVEDVEILSSCIYNGGLSETSTVAVMQVDPDYMNDEPVSDVISMIDSLGLPKDTVCFMTAAEVDIVFSENTAGHNGCTARAFATAGLANQVIAGDEITDWNERHDISMKRHAALIEHAGTINIIGITDSPLTDSAKVNAVIAMTEAKTAALHDLGFKETGTTSDAVAIVCPKNGTRQDYAGTGSDLGISLARSVRSSVRCALIKRNDFPYNADEGTIDEIKRRYA